MGIQYQHITESSGSAGPLKRFYFRTLCGILLPLAFASYFIWTYLYWLRPGSNPSIDTEKPIPNGLYVWWSWFFIGAIGLNVSNYTLAGVEAAMMMTSRFRPKTKQQIKMHRDMPWSTISAWAIFGKEIFRIIFERSEPQLSGLWILLFGLSTSSWTFVLSGLSMETYSGYKAGKAPGSNVVGINQVTMNNRPSFEFIDLTVQQWKARNSADIPLGSTLYVPVGAKSPAPNGLPEDASSEVFLTPQSTVPVTGQLWGTILKYNCTGVNKLSQFSILNRRINSSNPAYLGSGMYESSDVDYFYTLEDGSSISVLSQLLDTEDPQPTNIIGFAEIGLSTGFGSLVENSATWGYSRSCLTCENDTTPSYSGLDEEEVFEIALWQAFNNPPGTTGNFTNVNDPIPELKNEHTQPIAPFPVLGSSWDGSMQAIGVRCTSSSVTATAKVNGLAGTFTEFQRSDPESSNEIPPAIPRLSLGIPLMFLQVSKTDSENFLNYAMVPSFQPFGNSSANYTLVNTNYTWLGPLAAASNDFNLSATAQNFVYYHSLIQMPNLTLAITAAYQQYAAQLMFQGSRTLDDAWYNPNVTASEPWTLMRAASTGISPIFILITMLIWALSCVGLSLIYGLRKRWSTTFDDRFLYCFSKDKKNEDLGLGSLDFLWD